MITAPYQRRWSLTAPRHTPEAARVIMAMRQTRDAARRLLDTIAGYKTSYPYPITPDEIETARKIANWEIPEL